MKRFCQFLLFLMIIYSVSGCAHGVSRNLRERADTTLTFRQVFQDPNEYKGKFVIWGGDIIQTMNQKDGTTLIEIFQRPLNWREEPKETLSSEGRFLVLAEKYLDPYVFRSGKRMTAAGEIQGEKIRPLGEMNYRYPLLLSKQIVLWEDYYYYPSPYYYPYPYYWWWGYPYWLR